MNAVKQFKMLAAAAAVVMFAIGCGDGDNSVTPTAEYTLNINLSPIDGGSVDCKPSKTTYKAGEKVTVTATAASGYRFVRWTGVSTSTNTSITVTVNANLELTANFESTTTPPTNSYDITFNPNSGTVSPTSAKTGTDGKLASLPTPERSGYTFDGWYTAATGGTAVTTATVFNANATIYAHWTQTPVANTYDITFNPNSGTVSPTSAKTGTDGKLASLPTPERSGYTFDGWYTAATGGTAVTTATVFNTNATIYARWTENTVTPPSDNTFTDSRDNKTYKKVTIGSQTWMAENLNYDIPNVPSDVCYNNDQTYCDKYGRLYTWSDAMNNVSSSSENPSGVQGACPVGWHLPSDAEWAALLNYVGSFAGQRLRSETGWSTSTVVGTDEFGFAALPGGYISGSSSYNVGSNGVWWSTTASSATNAYRYGMAYGSRDVTRDYNVIGYLFSVRCVQD